VLDKFGRRAIALWPQWIVNIKHRPAQPQSITESTMQPFTPDQPDNTVSLTDVQRAIESDAIVPCFQPIVELRTGRLAGLEVLACWENPEHGLVLPQNFISMAEENGLIGQLTNQVLTKAFFSTALLPEPLFLAVNISPIQLHNLSLPHQIRDAADDYGFPLKQLTVEITESALLNNLERARRIAIELRDMAASWHWTTSALDIRACGISRCCRSVS
jgi:predicted signal transduction protein with EAL and GGDEF domain